jgi:hypothetical protein
VLLQGLLKLWHQQQVLCTRAEHFQKKLRNVAAQLQQRIDVVAFGHAFIVASAVLSVVSAAAKSSSCYAINSNGAVPSAATAGWWSSLRSV